MAGLLAAQKNALLDALLRGSTFTAPTSPYKLSLHTADPGTTGASEVTGGSYARQTVAFNAASAGQSVNTSDVSFTGMPAATVTHVSVWDSAGTPNFIWSGALAASKTTSSGDTLTIPASQLTATLT